MQQYGVIGQAPQSRYCPSEDTAKRASDIVTLAALAGDTGRWVAIRLIDGGYDGTVYDSREDAISHQLHPEHCTYVLIPPGGMTPNEAKHVIAYWRELTLHGVKDDRTDVQWPTIPLLAVDRQRQIAALTKGRK